MLCIRHRLCSEATLAEPQASRRYLPPSRGTAVSAQPCPRRLGVRELGLVNLRPVPGERDLLAERKGKEVGEGERSQVQRDGEKWGSGDREGGLAERQRKHDQRKGRRGLGKFGNATNRAEIQALLAGHT